MDHAVDLIGNGLCEFIVVPGIITVDCDIHTAKVGRPGGATSGQSRLREVPTGAIEMWQGQFRQTEGADASIPCCTFAAIDLIWLISPPSPFLMPPESSFMKSGI